MRWLGYLALGLAALLLWRWWSTPSEETLEAAPPSAGDGGGGGGDGGGGGGGDDGGGGDTGTGATVDPASGVKVVNPKRRAAPVASDRGKPRNPNAIALAGLRHSAQRSQPKAGRP